MSPSRASRRVRGAFSGETATRGKPTRKYKRFGSLYFTQGHAALVVCRVYALVARPQRPAGALRSMWHGRQPGPERGKRSGSESLQASRCWWPLCEVRLARWHESAVASGRSRSIAVRSACPYPPATAAAVGGDPAPMRSVHVSAFTAAMAHLLRGRHDGALAPRTRCRERAQYGGFKPGEVGALALLGRLLCFLRWVSESGTS